MSVLTKNTEFCRIELDIVFREINCELWFPYVVFDLPFHCAFVWQGVKQRTASLFHFVFGSPKRGWLSL